MKLSNKAIKQKYIINQELIEDFDEYFTNSLSEHYHYGNELKRLRKAHAKERAIERRKEYKNKQQRRAMTFAMH